MQGRRYSEIILLWSKEDKNCVGIQEYTLEFVFHIYGFPTLSLRESKDSTNKYQNISQE